MTWPSWTSCAAIVVIDTGLVRDDLLLDVGGREVELDGDHALAGRVLEVLEDALVSGVVRDDQAEARRGVERDPEPVDRQLAAVVAERVEHHRGVLSSLDDLVEVADGTLPHRSGQRAVDPGRVAALGGDSARRDPQW